MTAQQAWRFTPASPLAPAPEHCAADEPNRRTGRRLTQLLTLTAVGAPSIVVASAPAVDAAPLTVDATAVTPTQSLAEQNHLMVHTTPAEQGPSAVLSPFWGQEQGAVVQIPDTPGTPDPPAAATPPSQRVVEGTVTVRSGESLWSITQQLLGPEASVDQVAATWPQLWEANGQRIPNPDLVQPGTILVVPDSLRPG